MTVIEKPMTPSAPPPEPSMTDRTSGSLLFFGMTGLLIALMASLLVIGVIGLLDDDGGSAGGAAASSTIDVSLSEFAIDGNLVATPGNVTLAVVNAGSQQHDLVVEPMGARTPLLNGGENATLALGSLDAGEYRLFCSIAGHAESGMDTTLVVGDGAAAGGHSAGGHGSGEYDAEAMDAKMIESMLAFPAATEGMGNQILEPEILPDGTKKFVLEASVIDWEVSPGEFVEAWAYNGQVPGPQIIVDVGDKVQVDFTNNTPLGSDIHWHGIQTPNTQDGVAPFTQVAVGVGETFTYEFIADRASIGMYHAHLHSQISVLNGMFAAFRIGDRPYPAGQTIGGVTIPEDFEPAVEIPMILNDAGTIGLSLNGKSFPATEPIVVEQDDWIVIHYYNEGLQIHPMHLHQMPQLVFAKDGFPIDNPQWEDTVNVAPGERFSVLVHASDPGVWVLHCHILTHAEREEGMFGMVTAMIVE